MAGAFYPGNAPQLAAELGELLDGVERLEPKFGFPKALIVPHAGYIYSGPVAARAYDELAAARGIVKRVVLLGPTHYVAGRGLALPAADAFETPLGRIPVDAEAAAALDGLQQVVRSAPAHAQEHSLEVQLPFLQQMLGEFTLVPLAIGAATREEVAEVLERLWGGPETLVVISTDLSHYHAYDEAQAHRRRDAAADCRPGDRPRPRRSLRRDGAERLPGACAQEGAVDQAARRLQFGRHRRRQGARGRLFLVRALRRRRGLGGGGRPDRCSRSPRARSPTAWA